MKVACPCCGEALNIEAVKGQFRAVRTADREALPLITVENLEHSALRSAEQDDHSIGRGSWTSTKTGDQFTVTLREGNPFLYRVITAQTETTCPRDYFSEKLRNAQYG